MGTEKNVLSFGDPRVGRFFDTMERKHPFKVGMDSCTVPGAVNYCRHILPESLDTCEGGRFSCYIGADMVMVPCSFDQKQRYQVRLKADNGEILNTIESVWNSEPFERFRDILRRSCPRCEKQTYCMGGCPLMPPLMPQVVLCNKKNS